MLGAHLGFQEALGVAHAVQTQVADVRLRRHEGHRHLVADAGLAQRGLQDEEELVGGTEARGALRRADDHRAGGLQQLLEDLLGAFGVVDVADRLGEAAMRAEARNLVEGQFRARGDDQVIIADRVAIDQGDAVLFGVQLFGGDGDEVDLLLGHGGGQVHRDLFALAPTHGDPGVGGHEVIGRVLGDDGHRVFLAQLVLQLIGHDGSSEPGPQDDDMCHGNLPC